MDESQRPWRREGRRLKIGRRITGSEGVDALYAWTHSEETQEMIAMRKAFAWSFVLALGLAVPVFAGQAAAAKTTQAKAPAAPVNLNSASQAELEALPAVGPATAKKIIAGRPYATVADLAKAGVPKNTIEKITSM